jgi:hypothetical protein
LEAARNIESPSAAASQPTEHAIIDGNSLVTGRRKRLKDIARSMFR